MCSAPSLFSATWSPASASCLCGPQTAGFSRCDSLTPQEAARGRDSGRSLRSQSAWSASPALRDSGQLTSLSEPRLPHMQTVSAKQPVFVKCLSGLRLTLEGHPTGVDGDTRVAPSEGDIRGLHGHDHHFLPHPQSGTLVWVTSYWLTYSVRCMPGPCVLRNYCRTWLGNILDINLENPSSRAKSEVCPCHNTLWVCLEATPSDRVLMPLHSQWYSRGIRQISGDSQYSSTTPVRTSCLQDTEKAIPKATVKSRESLPSVPSNALSLSGDSAPLCTTLPEPALRRPQMHSETTDAPRVHRCTPSQSTESSGPCKTQGGVPGAAPLGSSQGLSSSR